MEAATSEPVTATSGTVPTTSRPPQTHIVDDCPVNGQSWRNTRFDGVFQKPEDYPTGEPLYCEVELPGTPLTTDYHGRTHRRKVRVSVWGDHVFLGFDGWYAKNGRGGQAKQVDPFCTVQIVTPVSYEKQVTREVVEQVRAHTFSHGSHRVQRSFTDCYWHPKFRPEGHHDNGELPPEAHRIAYRWLRYRFTLEDGTTFEAEYKAEVPLTGQATVADDGIITCEANFFGHTQTWDHETLAQTERQVARRYGGHDTYRNDPLATLLKHLRESKLVDGVLRWWSVFLALQPGSKTPDTKGLSSVLGKKDNKPCFEKLAADFPVEWAFLQWLMSGRTSEKFQNNKFLAAMFTDMGFDAEKIAAEARKLMESPPNGIQTSTYRDKEPYFEARRGFCKAFGSAAEVIRQVEEKTDFSKRKDNAGKADGLGIDADRFPKLRAAVESGEIPASVFANPDKAPVNREFVIWERALSQPGWADEVYKIAQDAGRRSTYEKDITPYLAFCLYKLPAYLDRHVEGKKKWSCKPRYVESEWDLEMGEEANEGGTTKRRSAFTPVADNETRVVEVPYVAVCVTGRVSQWCYSKHYFVFEEGMIDPVSGGVVAVEVEEKLNGRDDYGLMFYTLNGTATAQGYPTFLIIFERRSSGTFVHFHRVHPKRKDNGQWTPACQLIERVYQYMAGDVPASEVRAQQGDMVYIKHPHDPLAAGAKVEDQCKAARGLAFESHNHVALGSGEVKLWISTAKTPRNRLGFMEVPEGGMAVRHPEHDDIEYLEAGWYEVRRCRSWEANPRAIWSLTID